VRNSSLARSGKPSFDVASKRLKVVQLSDQELPDQIEVDVKVAVDEHVAETRNCPKMRCEIIGQHVHICKSVNGGCVVRRVMAGGQCEMGRYVERVLDTEMKAAFNQPSKIGIVAELIDSCMRMPA